MTTKNRVSKTIFLVVSMLFGWIIEAFPATVPVSNFNNIRDVLDGCSNGDTISVSSDFSLTSSVAVNKSVTILGNGHTIKRGNASARIDFSADVKVSKLTFDANSTSSSNTSFILVSQGNKVTMDGETVIRNSGEGPVVILEGKLVGGVITGNKVSGSTSTASNRHSSVVWVRANGALVNSLVYGNTAAGRNSDNASYVVRFDGLVINCTIVKNSLSGISNNGRTTYAYALGASSSTGLIYNSLICMNTHASSSSRADVDVEFNTYLSSANFQSGKNYRGSTNPGFVDANNNNFALEGNSAYVNAGDDSYNTEAYDLAGNERISGLGIDLGAYEYQECATIKASKSTNVIYGEKITLEVDKVSSSFNGMSISYQWQSSKDGSDWSNIGKDANSNRYVIESVSKDIPYYRLHIVKKTNTSEVLCTSNVIQLQFAAPYVKFFASGYERVVTHYAFEAIYGSTFTIGLDIVNDARITKFSLKRNLLQRRGVAEVTYDPSELDNYKLDVKVDEAYEFELEYTYQIGTGNAVSKDTTFILRPIYKCTGKKNQLIWHDDFGTFNPTNYSYTYKDANTGAYKTITSYSELDPRDRQSTFNVRYNSNSSAMAVPDFNGALRGHDFFSRHGSANSDWHTDDAFYSIVPNSNYAWVGQDQFGTQLDHTKGDGKGGMLVVNCAVDSKDTRIYQRDFSVECDSSLVIFSSYIANLNMWDVARWGSRPTLINANVRLDIYELDENGNEKKLQSAYSGEMLSRLHDYDSDPNVDTYWSNLSAKFLADAGKTYRVVLVNNSNGGYGNDMMFDDITITACCPDMAISDNPSFVNEKQSVEVCGTDSSDFTIYAIMRDGTVASDYFISPYYYLYQYRAKGDTIWKNFIEGNNPYLDTFSYKVDLTTFPSGAECRAILARSKTRIQQIVSYYNSSYNDPNITEEELRYPPVECKEGVYGVAYGFSISYYPELGEISSDKVKYACPGEEVSFSYDPGQVWTERKWLDAEDNEVASGISYTFSKTQKEIDGFKYVIAGEGGICPDTIVFEAHVNRSLAFGDVDDIYKDADASCQATVALDGEKPDYSYCAADLDHVEYYYRLNSSGAWTKLTSGATARVSDKDTIVWRGLLFLNGVSGVVDSVFYRQPVHVTDKTAPVIVRCGTLENVFALASSEKVSGNVSVDISASDIQNASEDNCTASSDLNVLWNAGMGDSYGTFGGYAFVLNAYTNPFVEYAWKVEDEAGLLSEPCRVNFEIKKDTTDEKGDPYAIIRDTLICTGDFPLTWHGRIFSKDGDTAHVGYTLLRAHADSSFYRTFDLTACSLLQFNGKTYDYSGTFKDTVYNTTGCDSIYTLNVTINDTYNTTETVTACDSFLWNGSVYVHSGKYSKLLKSVAGCDSVANLNLTIGYSHRDTIDVACANEYYWDVTKTTYKTSGQYKSDLRSVTGCDSIDVLNLTIYQPSYGTVYKTICRGDLPFRYQPGFSHAGDTASKLIVSDTTFTFPRYQQGDSIIRFNMTILEASASTYNVAVCENKFPYTFDTRSHLVVYQPREDTVFVIKNQQGCDSVITLNINLLKPSDTTFITRVACDSFIEWGETFTEDTIVVKDFINASGCDSVVVMDLTVNHTVWTVETLPDACDSVLWNNKWYYEDNNTDTLMTKSLVTGCDSIVTLNVKVNHSYRTKDQLRLCTGNFGADGKYRVAQWDTTIVEPATTPAVITGKYQTKTVTECDSIVDYTIFVDNSIVIRDTIVAKDSLIWSVDGNVYKTSGEYGDLASSISSVNCDSSAHLVLHIIPTKNAVLNRTACETYSYKYNDLLYKTDKDTVWNLKYQYDTTLVAMNGAVAYGDSILSIHVTVNHAQTVILPADTSCGPTVWNGLPVNRTGQYQVQMPSLVNGCDSTTIIRFLVLNVKRDTVREIVCDSFLWDVTGVKYTRSGFYSDTLRYRNSFNCDSVIRVLDLQVLEKSERIISERLSASEYANYYVEDFHPDVMDTLGVDGVTRKINSLYDASAGIYPSIVSNYRNAAGCDSILKFDVTLLASSDETVLRDTICLADLPYNVTVGAVDYVLYGDTSILLKNQIGGDSLVVIDLQINQASTPVTESIDACGLSYEWNGGVYTDNAKDTIHVLNALGCDSTVYLALNLHKPTYYVEEIAACDSFEWNGVLYKESVTPNVTKVDYTFNTALATISGQRVVVDPSLMLPYYVEKDKNVEGCDSIVILSLNITKTVYGDTISASTCDSFPWLVTDEHPTGIYTKSGIYSARLVSKVSNCDSVVTLNLTVRHSSTLDTTLYVCENQQAKLGDVVLKGDSVISLTNADKCDSIINVKVVFNPVYDTTFVAATCDSVYKWRGKIYRQTGLYTDSLKTIGCGCDSVVRLQLTMNQLPVVTIDTTVCGRFDWNGKSFTHSANILDTFQSVTGCDSVVNVNLVVTEPTIAPLAALELAANEDCKGDLGLDTHKPAYQYCDDNAKADYWFSVDSIAWTHVDDNATVNVVNGDTIYWRVILSDSIGKIDSVTVSQSVTVVDKTAPEFVESCESWVSVYSVVDTISGNVTFSLAADSIRTKMSDNCTDVLDLDVQWNVNGTGFTTFVGDTTFTLNAYKGDSIVISWKVADQAGNESDICDKVYEIERDKKADDSINYSIIRDTFVCAGEIPFTWHGAEFKADGDTAHVGSTLLRVHVDKSFFVNDSVVACQSLVWRGKTLTASGIYKDTISSSAACDSVYTLNLTILEPSKVDTVLNVCEAELPITLGASTITSDTIITLTNAAGCDSIVTVKLNVASIKSDTLHQIACGSFVWNNVEYTTSGFYSDTLKSAAGCDSISSLDLVVSPVKVDTVYDSFSCGAYTWHGNAYTTSGIYSDTLSTSLGCDSIVTLVLTYEPKVINVAMNTCEGLPGNFRGHVIEGDTVMVLPDENGCSVHYSITLHVTPAFSGDTASVFACYSYNWNGRVLTESGIYRDTLSSSVSGCDSVAILDLTISKLPVYGDTAVVSACETYEWLGKTYTVSGLYFDTIPTAIGCDSIIAIDLSIAHPDTVYIDTTIAVGQSIDIYGFKVDDAAYGSYKYDTTIVTIAGCETLLHITVNAAGRPIVVDSVEISGGENGHGGEDSIPDIATVIDTTSTTDTTGVGPVISDSLKVSVKGGLWFCQGDVANVKFFTSGAPETYAVKFDSSSVAAGFMETSGNLDADGIVRFDIPENVAPGVYNVYVQLFGEGMSSQLIKVKFYVSLGSGVIKRKWNDVLVCSNPDSFFVEYQWYHNNVKLEGETSQYISVLTGVEGTYSLDVVTLYGDTLHICGKDFELLMPEFSITAFPVPAVANKEFTIQVNGLDKSQLSKAKLVVYSVDGVVKYMDLDGIEAKNALSLPIGEYVAVVTVENGLSANCKILVRP